MIDFYDTLKAVAVDCKDDGVKFVVKDRIDAIKGLLQGTGYRLLHEGDLCLIYGKRPIEAGQERVVISSHIDCVFGRCFCKTNGELLIGTLDNCLTNAAVVTEMMGGELDDDVLIAFTGDEERNSGGCLEVKETLERLGCKIGLAIVTDVTEEGWESACPFTIENDLCIDMLTAHRIIESLKCFEGKYVLVHDAEPDEAWTYGEAEIACFTLCAPIMGEMHSDSGAIARAAGMPTYCRALRIAANCIGTGGK